MLKLALALIALGGSALASPLASQHTTPAVKTLYTFPDGSFIENIALTQSNRILVTTVTHPHIYILDPRTPNPTPRVLLEFNATFYNAVAGIGEYRDNHFAVLTAQADLATLRATNTAVWTFEIHNDTVTGAPKLAADLPEGGLPNGLTVLPKSRDMILISDAARAVLYRVNVTSGNVEQSRQDDELFGFDAAAGPPLGINGIRTTPRGDLYFVNSNRGFVARVPINARTGTFLSKPSIIAHVPATQAVGYDDFALHPLTGDMWIAAPPTSLNVVRPATGETFIALTGLNISSSGAGPTSGAFLRGFNQKILYITSAEGVLYEVDTGKVPLVH